MTNTPHVLTDRLSANYVKHLLANPKDSPYNNLDKAIYETPLACAAPFLLEALQEAQFMIESFEGTNIENEKIIDMVRVALAKAGV